MMVAALAAGFRLTSHYSSSYTDDPNIMNLHPTSSDPSDRYITKLMQSAAGDHAYLNVPIFSISGSPPTTGAVGVAYAGSIAASGGVTPYVYSVASGTLPAGLSLNASTGAISGSPTTISTYTGIVFRATDDRGVAADLPAQSINITAVVPGPVPGTLTYQDNTGYSNQVTVPYTVPTGTNRALVVAVYNRKVADVTGITWGGTALTKKATAANNGVAGVEIWSLVAPATGAANVVVSLSDYDQSSVAVLSLTNVDQTTPIEAVSNTGTDGTYGSTTSASITTTSTNALVLEFTECNGAATATPGSGQTSLVNTKPSDANMGQRLASRKLVATAGSTTMTWGIGSAQSFLTAAISVRKAA